jgi:DNA repair protein RecN (Recombination protein N)
VLSRLHIRNLAVLDEIELDLAAGFTALTGETGAGKSMLVDALALALGERADSSAVRAGAARAEVTAEFDIAELPGVGRWLGERDLDADGECQVRRVVTREGRSRGYVNGQPVPMESLRELGEQLLEICGQHAHQSLVRRPTQRAILDAHGGHDELLARMAETYAAWSALERERTLLLADRRERESRRDLVGYQLREIAALELGEGEVETLEIEQVRLANVDRIASGLARALDQLYDAESSAHDTVGSARREVESLAALDPDLTPAVEALELARIQLVEASDGIRRRLAGLERDPARQEEVEARLAAVLDLARKHRRAPETVWRLRGELEVELATLDACDERLGTSDAESEQLAARLREAAEALRAARLTAARSLARAVTANLHALGMAGSTFIVELAPLLAEKVGPGGADEIEFRIVTNPGQAPQPIAKIASGGELSRLSLAIQVVAMTGQGAGTLIFDEVDAGIGGGVAEIVGRNLRRLSGRRQVLCVTHLPQVASQADRHFAVTKTAVADETRTAVRELDAPARVEEIARMLGGVKITARSRDHAREMLEGARARRAG